MNENGTTRITEVEVALFVLLLTLPADILGFIVDWTGVGLAIVPIAKGGVSALTYLFFSNKGGSAGAGKQTAKLVGKYLGMNSIPLWPTTTSLFVFDVYQHNKAARGGTSTAVASGATTLLKKII